MFTVLPDTPHIISAKEDTFIIIVNRNVFQSSKEVLKTSVSMLLISTALFRRKEYTIHTRTFDCLTRSYPIVYARRAQGQNMGYGILSGMFGFNMNVNYQPMVGWGFNSNLGVQTPWFTFIPYTNSYPMTFQNTYISPYFPSSWNSRSEDQNAGN
uniref:Uncharacterized protein n=1 Tax=Heterorhabditis bacteriophora TaxID=37862 RepID=A0A1I7X8Z8_HETBA